MAEPLKVLAGTTVSWTVPPPAAAGGAGTFRADEGWSLTYVLLGPAKLEVAADAAGEGFVVTVSAEASADWAPGWYTWSAFVARDVARHLVATGTLVVLADPAQAEAGEGRSHARRMLAAIEAVLEGRASADVEEYSIAGRSLKKIPVAELLTLRARYRAEVLAEERAEARARGLPGGRLVRMTGLGRRF